MNWSITRLVSTSAFIAALGLATSQANAQRATFNLPSEARWGSTLLHPGTYTLDSSDSPSIRPVYYLHGNDGTKLVAPQIVGKGAASGRSYLQLVNVDGTNYVREFVFGANATALRFAIPKAVHRELSAQDRVLVSSGF